jgi:hypothetical protein
MIKTEVSHASRGSVSGTDRKIGCLSTVTVAPFQVLSLRFSLGVNRAS